MLVTKPMILEYTDADTALKIMEKAVKYGITTQINGNNSDGHRQVLNQFSISKLIEKIEEHIKTMRSNAVSKSESLVKKLRDINQKIKKSNFNGGYIKASQEAYELLVKNGYKSFQCIMLEDAIEYGYIVIKDNLMFGAKYHELQEYEKQFYINNGALSWDEPLPPFAQIMKDRGANVHILKPIQINSMEDLNELPTIGDDDELIYQYRAKIPFKDEYIEGYLVQGENCYIITEDDFYNAVVSSNDYHMSTFSNLIDASTLSIHFPDMLDSEGTKIFASLSEDGKGGDLLESLDNRVDEIYVMVFRSIFGIKLQDVLSPTLHYGFYKDKIKVTGIQQ